MDYRLIIIPVLILVIISHAKTYEFLENNLSEIGISKPGPLVPNNSVSDLVVTNSTVAEAIANITTPSLIIEPLSNEPLTHTPLNPWSSSSIPLQLVENITSQDAVKHETKKTKLEQASIVLNAHNVSQLVDKNIHEIDKVINKTTSCDPRNFVLVEKSMLKILQEGLKNCK